MGTDCGKENHEGVGGRAGGYPSGGVVEYVDRQITLTATGGLLTMLSQAGSGTLAGNAHAETFQQIERSDAVVLSGVLQRGIDVPLLAEFFPGQPVQAYFEFAPGASAESARVVEDAVRLARAGYRMDAEMLAEKTGYRVSVVGAEKSGFAAEKA